MTPFQRHAWRRYGFLIVDNHRAQLIRGEWYAAGTVVERGGGVTPATLREMRLWNALRRAWSAQLRGARVAEDGTTLRPGPEPDDVF